MLNQSALAAKQEVADALGVSVATLDESFETFKAIVMQPEAETSKIYSINQLFYSDHPEKVKLYLALHIGLKLGREEFLSILSGN